MKKVDLHRDERGFVLILALVTMVAMTIIGITMVMNMTTDMQLARNEREAKTAFQLAEAGINEAIARMHLSTTNAKYIGELTTDANYRTTSWNLNNTEGKNFGLGYGGNRESADGLNYEVSITYLDESNYEGFCDSNNNVSPNNSLNATSPPTACDDATAEVVMYGQDFNIDSSITAISWGKQPVYRLVSTGTSNGTTRTIEAYVGASSLNTDTEYGINTNACVTVAGGANTLGAVRQGSGCGCDAQLTNGCASNKSASDDLDWYLGEQLSTVITMADERHQCLGATCTDPGDDIPSSGSIDTVVTDWGDYAGNTYSTMVYIDNQGGKDVSLSGNYTGRGILIVTGNLKLTGNLSYEGLIYVLGRIDLGGGGNTLNVTGGVMANNVVDVNGNITVTYDQATLHEVAKESSSSANLIWKRL